MAAMPIEIIDIGDVPIDDLTRAISLANRAQNDFRFLRADDDAIAEMQQYSFQRVTTSTIFDGLLRLRSNVRGYHPFLVAVMDSHLDGKRYSNLFGTHRAKDGMAIITTASVLDVILPANALDSYLIYYFARYALSFVSPAHRNHEDPRRCVFDRKVEKKGIVDSMRARALCDECRQSLLNATQAMSPRQFRSLNQLFELSGQLLESSREGHRMENEVKPRIFIGSSVEGLPVARAIQSELNHDYHVELWSQSDVFRLGAATLEALETALDVYDYGVFVFTPDDQVIKREDQHQVARDNVLFEAGLFIGRKSRYKAFVVHPRDLQIQLPSDLSGIASAKYESKAPNLNASVGAACNEIRSAIVRSAVARTG